MIRVCSLIAIFLLGMAACASPSNEEETNSDDGMSLEEAREKAWKDIDVEACEAKGGEVRQEGMLGLPRCVIDYADAGQPCSDSSDCEGKCLGSDDITDYKAAPGEMQGRCEADDSPFGCYAEIINGTAGPALCVD